MTVAQTSDVLTGGAPPVVGRRRRRRHWDRSGYVFAAPAMVLATIFSLLPLVLAFVYSFARIAPLSGRISWVGTDNYVRMLTDATFYRALVNTVIFTVLVVPVSMGLGLALAVLLNSVMPARKLFRTIIYLPLVISGVAVGLIGTFFFNETIGVVNKLLATLSLPGIPWQSSGVPAFASVIQDARD